MTGAVAEIEDEEDEEDELDLEVFGSGCVSVGMRYFQRRTRAIHWIFVTGAEEDIWVSRDRFFGAI